MQNPHCAAPVSRNACLERAEPVAVGQPLDRRDVPAVGLGREHEARVHAPVVDQHGARAALADEAALLRPGQRRGRRAGRRAACGAARRRRRAARPLTRERDRDRVASRGRRSRPAARSRRRPRAGRGRGASPAGTRGSPASTSATGSRPRTARSSTLDLASSGAAGSARTPGLVDDEERPRAEAAVGQPGHPVGADRAGQRDGREVVAAPAGPADVDGAAAARAAAAARSR